MAIDKREKTLAVEAVAVVLALRGTRLELEAALGVSVERRRTAAVSVERRRTAAVWLGEEKERESVKMRYNYYDDCI